MTRHPSGRLKTSFLKLCLVMGGVASTLVGAELLARQEVTTPVIAAAPNQVLVIPEQRDTTVLTVNSNPIPQLQIPQVVTRSRSSR